MNRKKGITKSAIVKPFQGAWSSAANPFGSEALFTKFMNHIVRPLIVSSDTKRSFMAYKDEPTADVRNRTPIDRFTRNLLVLA